MEFLAEKAMPINKWNSPMVTTWRRATGTLVILTPGADMRYFNAAKVELQVEAESYLI
jgi:hypothetical protein